MSTDLTVDELLGAVSPGGPSCLTSVTRLEPAAGPHASIAPAKFAERNNDRGTYAYERRYLEGQAQDAVLVDSKQSTLNRMEQSLSTAIVDGHPTLSRLPRLVVTYDSPRGPRLLSDLDLPHRAFDAHIRAGTVEGVEVTQLTAYRAIRDAQPGNARALLDASPASLVFGSWDSSRASRQGRWRSLIVGEIVGFTDRPRDPATKGGARLDPLGQSIELTGEALKALADAQRSAISDALYKKVVAEAERGIKKGERVKASTLGLGGIPPSLEALAGVACHTVIRSHVLSFAALRQLRFAAGAEGDAACRALLAALALNALARSDAELSLRANCDLREAGPTAVTIDRRGGDAQGLTPLTVEAADALLDAALAHAENAARVVWNGPVLQITGNPAIPDGAVDDEQDA